MKRSIFILFGLLFVHVTCTPVYSQGHVQADIYWDKAQKLQKEGKFFTAAEMYAKSAEAEKQSSWPRIIDLFSELYLAGHFYAMAGKYEISYKYLSEAHETAVKAGDQEKISAACNRLGFVAEELGMANLRIGKYGSALLFFKTSLDNYNKLEKKERFADLLNSIGMCYLQTGLQKKSVKYFDEALLIAMGKGDSAQTALVLGNISMAYYDMKDYEKAILLKEEAITALKKLDDKNGIAKGLITIGCFYEEDGENKKAVESLENALAIREKIGVTTHNITDIRKRIEKIKKELGKNR